MCPSFSTMDLRKLSNRGRYQTKFLDNLPQSIESQATETLNTTGTRSLYTHKLGLVPFFENVTSFRKPQSCFNNYHSTIIQFRSIAEQPNGQTSLAPCDNPWVLGGHKMAFNCKLPQLFSVK